jgi:tripartite-type tricarboxylate transporter receptor subunit TctC
VAIVNKVHDAAEKALQDPGLKERLAKLGVEPEPMSVDAFGKYVRDDIAGTADLAKQAHIEPLD